MVRDMDHNYPPPALTDPKPKELGPFTARIRVPGKPELMSRGVPSADAALEWAYGYTARRTANAEHIHRQFPNGTTVHIGPSIFILHNRVLRPMGYRRVVAVKSPPKVGP